MTAMIEYDADGEFEMVPDEDVELCWDPDLGPVGKGPHEPRPYEEPIRRTDDGRERFVWDEDEERYISPIQAAQKGEKKNPRPKRPSRIFVEHSGPGDILEEMKKQFEDMTKKELQELMKKYRL